MIQANYKHEQLAEVLREEIFSGAFAGGRFHTVKAMMERFQVSQATLTRALQPLYEEGLIYSVSGKGTFVARELKNRASSVPGTIYCIAAYEEMFDPARTSPDWCFTQLMVNGIVSAARKHDMTVNIAPMATTLDAFKRIAVPGSSMCIFLNYNTCEQLVEYAVKKQIPYSLYINDPIHRKLNLVFCDVGKATEDAVEYLIGRGHRNIIFLGDCPDSARHRGYRRALRRHGIPYRSDYCWFNYRALPDPIRLEVEQKIDHFPEVTAIMATSDLCAVGVWNAVKNRPQKPALISMDNMWKYYNFPTPLTTMDMHLEQAGEALLENLLKKARDGRDRQQTIPYSLSQGETA